jgi:hypothetical protein
MAMDQVSVICGGILTLLMFFFHLTFPKRFLWRQVFRQVKKPNSKIFYTLHIALYALFIGIAYISLRYSSELAKAEGLAQGILLVLALFWLWRTIWQIIYFKPRAGKRLMHFILTFWFGLLSICYIWPLIF